MGILWNSDDKHPDIQLWNMYTYSRILNLVNGEKIAARTTGKLYGKVCWNFPHIDFGATYGFYSVGIVSGDVNLDNWLSNYGWSYSQFGVINDHGVEIEDGNPHFISSDSLNFAFDKENGYLWIAINGVWVKSGDPANGLNPTITGIFGDDLYPAVGMYYSGDYCSAEFEGISCPAGFEPFNAVLIDAGGTDTVGIDDPGIGFTGYVEGADTVGIDDPGIGFTGYVEGADTVGIDDPGIGFGLGLVEGTDTIGIDDPGVAIDIIFAEGTDTISLDDPGVIFTIFYCEGTDTMGLDDGNGSVIYYDNSSGISLPVQAEADNWTFFEKQILPLSIIRYRCVLSSFYLENSWYQKQVIVLPVNTIQCKKDISINSIIDPETGEPTGDLAIIATNVYTVNVPDASAYAENIATIADASNYNPMLSLYMDYYQNNSLIKQEQVTTAELSEITYHKTPSYETCTIMAKSKLWYNKFGTAQPLMQTDFIGDIGGNYIYEPSVLVEKNIILDNPTERSIRDGSLSYSFAYLNPFLVPLASVLVGDDEYQSGSITYNIQSNAVKMTVNENSTGYNIFS